MKVPWIRHVWTATRGENELRMYYSRGSDSPQYAALHLNDSYFRLNYGPESGWGTSIILLPVFWTRQKLYQGARVDAEWETKGPDLLLSLTGSLDGLDFASEVRLSPPKVNRAISAEITTKVEGSILLDRRPGEAFKPVMLSSMHVSPAHWDTQAFYAENRSFSLPRRGWIIQPPVVGRRFTLKGGTSEWKKNAPTIEVLLDRPMQITGFVTESDNPNDDNVGVWAATDDVLSSWSYRVNATSRA